MHIYRAHRTIHRMMNLILRKKRTSLYYWFATPIKSQKLVARFLVDRNLGIQFRYVLKSIEILHHTTLEENCLC
jgi:hypothetical protein